MTASHSRYPHLFLVARFDSGTSPENALSVVSGWSTEDEAHDEAERLQQINPDASYRILVTRYKSQEWPQR